MSGLRREPSHNDAGIRTRARDKAIYTGVVP